MLWPARTATRPSRRPLRERGDAPSSAVTPNQPISSAPLTQRCSVRSRVRTRRDRVRSANAEMLRSRARREPVRTGPLRERGDVPDIGLRSDVITMSAPRRGDAPILVRAMSRSMQSAPRTRRCSGRVASAPCLPPVRSAYAEIFPTSAPQTSSPQCPLRVCGSTPAGFRADQSIDAASPRTWRCSGPVRPVPLRAETTGQSGWSPEVRLPSGCRFCVAGRGNVRHRPDRVRECGWL